MDEFDIRLEREDGETQSRRPDAGRAAGTRRPADTLDARHRLASARASLACEGMDLTAEEAALIEQMDRDGLGVEASIERAIAFDRARRQVTAAVAE